MKDRSLIGYWVVTGLFCAFMAGSGLAHTLRLGPIPQNMAALGYPDYFMSIIGIAKCAGVLALLAPERPLLKEWAYAGFTFNLLGASASHVFSGDPITEILAPLVALGLAAGSYLLRPDSRRLDASLELPGRV